MTDKKRHDYRVAVMLL